MTDLESRIAAFRKTAHRSFYEGDKYIFIADLKAELLWLFENPTPDHPFNQALDGGWNDGWQSAIDTILRFLGEK